MKTGMLEGVEACIVHLDVTSPDIHQVKISSILTDFKNACYLQIVR